MPLFLVPFVFATALFVSALLLFMVQPMIAKMVLPSLGGTPAVWNTCMVFFQALLLAGYAYAHASTKYLGVKRQATLHMGLLLFTLVVLLIVPLSSIRGWAPPGESNPVPYLLLFLLMFAGLPFFVISASAPMLQKWFSSTGHPSAKDPYFLYAASNLGSMLALLAYPVLVEPNLKLQQQSDGWMQGFIVLLLVTLVCAWIVWQTRETPATRRAQKKKGPDKASSKGDKSELIQAGSPRQGNRGEKVLALQALDEETPTLGKRAYWVALAIIPSSLMLGVTTYITMDIAAIPLLWVIPLSLYLLSFIIVFAKMPAWLDKLLVIGLIVVVVLFLRGLLPGGGADDKDTPLMFNLLRMLLFLGLLPTPLLLLPRVPPLLHKSMILALPVLILAVVFMMTSGMKPSTLMLIGLHLIILFVVAMVCHGELARTRPGTEFLTEFYLLMSLGGVLGGMFNALVAPMIFTQIAEYPLAMIVACMLLPNLAPDEAKTRVTLWTDVTLAFAPGLLALVLIWFAVRAEESDLTGEKVRGVAGDDRLRFALLLAGSLLGVAFYVFHKREDWKNRVLDVAAAVAIGLLAVGLIEFFLTSNKIKFVRLAEFFHMGEREGTFRRIIVYLVPLVLCYTLLSRSVRFGLSIGAVLLASSFCDALDSRVLLRDRSFFGVLNVKHLPRYFDDDVNGVVPESHQLVHGTTLHGKQFLDEDRRREALTYYHKTGPIGQVFETFEAKDSPKKLQDVALIGLGTGTLTSYGEPGRNMTVYDIDKAVVHIARDTGLFTFYTDAEARGVNLKIVLGDARLRMQDARDGQYDLIAVDAFSSDAIPIHLITMEALKLFRQKLKPDGIVAFHISNRYLDLEPVCANVAASIGMMAIVRNDRAETAPGKSSSTWVLVANKEEDFGKIKDDITQEKDDGKRWERLPPDRSKSVWTDDYSNIVSVHMDAERLKNTINESWFGKLLGWDKKKG